MAREVNRLSARRVQTETKPGRHSDGNGLYLIVDPSGAKRWLFIYRRVGKQKEMGLGGVGAVPLAEARKRRDKAREQLAAGVDPIGEKRAQKARSSPALTFGAFADQMIAEWAKGFKNPKLSHQWTQTIRDHAAALRTMPVNTLGTEDVLAALQPIWTTKGETASRLRGRIERILDAAKVKGLRSGENPARWRGHLDHLLPRRKKLTRGHHAAMPFVDVPAFVERLRERKAIAALGLEFLILTAARPGEARGAQWAEFDLDAKLWTVPAARMKAGRDHRVPLTDRAVQIVKELKTIKRGDFVFAGHKASKPLSNMAFDALLTRMKVDFTAHGFRSSFRDWAGEMTNFAREVAEAALAHAVGDEVELAYRRGDALEKRRRLMEAWTNYVTRGSRVTNVVEMKRA